MLQWMDDFGSYGTNDSLLLDGVYAEEGGTLDSDPDPNASGTVYRMGGGSSPNSMVRKVLTSGQTTVGIAMRLWLDELPDGTGYPVPMEFRDSGNNILVCVTVTSTGALEVRRNARDGTIIAQSSGPVVTADAWWHLEGKLFVDGTNGTIEIRAEGVPEIDADTLDTIGTAGSTCDQVSFAQHAPGTDRTVDYYVKDYVLWDGSGSQNNDFLGSVFVARLVPNADNTVNWSLSTGSVAYELIDESPPNDEVDYIYADDTPPAASLFGIENLPADITSVAGVMTMVRARKTDGGDGKLQVGLDVGGTVANGQDRQLTAAYTFWFDTFDLAPDGSAWTPADVDASLLRLDRTL